MTVLVSNKIFFMCLRCDKTKSCTLIQYILVKLQCFLSSSLKSKFIADIDAMLMFIRLSNVFNYWLKIYIYIYIIILK